jgi:hypothetical protein
MESFSASQPASRAIKTQLTRKYQIVLGNHALVRLAPALDRILWNLTISRSKADDFIMTVCGEAGDRRDKIYGLPDLEFVGVISHSDTFGAAEHAPVVQHGRVASFRG